MEQYEVKPVTDYLSEYNDKHRIILSAIEQLPPETPISERIRIYEEEVGKLKAQFSTLRKAEYESKSVELSRGHSCTSKSSGGVKNCGWKCVTAPKVGLYTKREWVRVVGTNKGISVSDNQACLKMTVAGKGKNKGTILAIFKYHPSFIETSVNIDTTTLFNLIVKSEETSNKNFDLDDNEEFMCTDERFGEHKIFDETND